LLAISGFKKEDLCGDNDEAASLETDPDYIRKRGGSCGGWDHSDRLRSGSGGQLLFE